MFILLKSRQTWKLRSYLDCFLQFSLTSHSDAFPHSHPGHPELPFPPDSEPMRRERRRSHWMFRSISISSLAALCSNRVLNTQDFLNPAALTTHHPPCEEGFFITMSLFLKLQCSNFLLFFNLYLQSSHYPSPSLPSSSSPICKRLSPVPIPPDSLLPWRLKSL